MTIRFLNLHEFRYGGVFKTKEEWDAGVEIVKDFLVVFFVAAMTAGLVISFSLL